VVPSILQDFIVFFFAVHPLCCLPSCAAAMSSFQAQAPSSAHTALSLVAILPPALPAFAAPSTGWYKAPASMDNFTSLSDHLHLLHNTATKLGLILTLLNKSCAYAECHELFEQTIAILVNVHSKALELHQEGPCLSLWSFLSTSLNKLSPVFRELITVVNTIAESGLPQDVQNKTSATTKYIGQIQAITGAIIYTDHNPSSSATPTLRKIPIWSNRTYIRRSVMAAAKALTVVVKDFVDANNNFLVPTLPTALFYEITLSDAFDAAMREADVASITSYTNQAPVISGEGLWTPENMLKVFNSFAEDDAAVVMAVVDLLKDLYGKIITLFQKLDERGDEMGESDVNLYAVDEGVAELTVAVETLAGTLSPSSLDVCDDGDTFVTLVQVVDAATKAGIDVDMTNVESVMEKSRLLQEQYS
jgi:hypothetical protein